MKIALSIKNTSRVVKPTYNDVIMYDGKEWYVTTKQDLFSDFDKKLKEFDDVLKENEKFKEKVSSQIHEMAELIKKLYEQKGE